MAFDVDLPLYESLSNHVVERRKGHRYCAWGRKRPGECVQGVQKSNSERKVLKEVVNEVRGSLGRSRQVHSFCTGCNVYLCTTQQCYRHWHVNLYDSTQ